MDKNFLKFMTGINPQPKSIVNTQEGKIPINLHIKFKLKKTKDKENIFREGERSNLTREL